jgi:hypothetical protein
VTRTLLAATATIFHQADVDAFEGDERVFCQSWDEALPRENDKGRSSAPLIEVDRLRFPLDAPRIGEMKTSGQ